MILDIALGAGCTAGLLLCFQSAYDMLQLRNPVTLRCLPSSKQLAQQQTGQLQQLQQSTLLQLQQSTQPQLPLHLHLELRAQLHQPLSILQLRLDLLALCAAVTRSSIVCGVALRRTLTSGGSHRVWTHFSKTSSLNL